MRFYVSQIIGDGVNEESAFRPDIDNHIKRWSMIDMRSDVSTGGLMFIQCEPTEQEHTNIIEDAKNTYIDTEDMELDDSLGLHSNLSVLLSDLEGYQVPTDDFSGSNTLRQLLQRIAKRFLIRQLLASSDVPNDLEAFLTPAQQAAAQEKANLLGVSPDLTKKSRDIIKEVAAINHPFLKTHYDN